MKAIQFHEFGDVDVLRLEDIPVPEPKQGEVLIRVQAAGVNADTLQRKTNTFTLLPYHLRQVEKFQARLRSWEKM